MKKLLITTALLLSLSANAQFVGEIDSNSARQNNTTAVEKVFDLRDESRVTVEGYIVNKLGSELYLFQDASGEIEIEIEKEDFRNIDISKSDKVRITAEIDRESSKISLEADYLELAP